MTTHFFGDTAVLTGRSLRHITRSLAPIITTTNRPHPSMHLSAYVFGARSTPASPPSSGATISPARA